jgi:pyruvate dehydrogenase E2 component (dihydrolipoamide acetyltransferase)
MASLITMPEVAAGATEIVLSQWHISVGDTVSVGDVIADIETEKASVAYESDAAGIVYKILVSDGATVEVGSPVMILLAEGEDGSAGDALLSGASSEAPALPDESVTLPTSSVEQSSPAHQEVPATTQSAADGTRRFVSPIVRKLARERGISLAHIQGTGPLGRVVRRDLEDFVANGGGASASQTPLSPAGSEIATQEFSSVYSTVPHTGMRRAIARRLTESKTTVPHFYVTADCKVDSLIELRKSINESSEVKISVNDFVVKAVACALMDVPEANVIWNPEAMHVYETADIAVAVTTEGGLYTPVVRGVEKRSLSNLNLEISDLAARARAGKLRQDELEGGSFTVSNLGMFGTQEFSAILNPPQSGILAVGAASERAVVVDGQIAIANVMTVTLSADHRAIDGALAAKWLAAFVQRIENPLSMLV